MVFLLKTHYTIKEIWSFLKFLSRLFWFKADYKKDKWNFCLRAPYLHQKSKHVSNCHMVILIAGRGRQFVWLVWRILPGIAGYWVYWAECHRTNTGPIHGGTGGPGASLVIYRNKLIRTIGLICAPGQQ